MVSGVWDISLLIYYRIFNSEFFFLFYTKATIVWHVLFTSTSLLWKCYKIFRNSCTNDSRATLQSIIVVIFCVIHIYVYIVFLFFTSIIIWKEWGIKRLVKVLKGWIPPDHRGSRDEYWRVLKKIRVLLNSVNLFVRMIIKFSYTAHGYFERPLYLPGKRGKCRQPAPFLRNPLLWDFCKGFTLTVHEQKRGYTDPRHWSHKCFSTGILSLSHAIIQCHVSKSNFYNLSVHKLMYTASDLSHSKMLFANFVFMYT